MNRPNLKSADEQLVDDPTAAFQQFTKAMRKLVELPKSAVESKPKRRSSAKKK